MTVGQLWSNYITQNNEDSNVEPVTTNERIVNQNSEDDKKYQNYKKGILQGIINGGKLNNEPTASQ